MICPFRLTWSCSPLKSPRDGAVQYGRCGSGIRPQCLQATAPLIRAPCFGRKLETHCRLFSVLPIASPRFTHPTPVPGVGTTRATVRCVSWMLCCRSRFTRHPFFEGSARHPLRPEPVGFGEREPRGSCSQASPKNRATRLLLRRYDRFERSRVCLLDRAGLRSRRGRHW